MHRMLDNAGFDMVLEQRASSGRPETMFVARKRHAPD
jgi:hypothetical protein